MRRVYPDRPVAAVGGVVLHEGKVLIVKRKVEPGAGLWSIPGGAVELGERARDALTREVEEETGLSVEPLQLLDVYDSIVKEGGRVAYHYILADYLCSYVDGSLRAATDVEEARWVVPTELEDYRMTETAPLAIAKAWRLVSREGDRR